MLFPIVLQTGTEEAGFYPRIDSPTEVDLALQSDYGLFSLVRFWHIRAVIVPPKVKELAVEEWKQRYSPRLMPAQNRSDWATWMDNQVREVHYRLH